MLDKNPFEETKGSSIVVRKVFCLFRIYEHMLLEEMSLLSYLDLLLSARQ